MKTKTVKQWLETLPKELSEAAISQCSEFQLKQKFNSLPIALTVFSNWFGTKEGFSFWYRVYCNVDKQWNLDNPPKKLKSIFNP